MNDPTDFIVFSDLHCTLKTWDLCRTILTHVHEEAVRLNSRVLFAGDMFDKTYCTGAISIELLNEMTMFFSPANWKVDMICIVGNHEMIKLSGGGNSLSVFGRLNPRITVIDRPTIFENALLVPYEHDENLFRATIDAQRGNPEIKCIFGHFDTIGARLNSAVISDRGVKADFFTIPTYSGHYHSPSKIGMIEYVGSPYQTSLSEAGDQKRMLVFGPGWTRRADLPLDFGPKYYKVTDRTPTSDIEKIITSGLRPMDKVVFDRLETLPPSLVEACESVGLVPIIRKKRRTQKIESGPDVETLTPQELFTSYLGANPRGPDDSALLAAGLAQLEGGVFGTSIPEAKDVNFISLEVENFGPFVGVHVLDLTVPGLTLVLAERTGRGDSNGCGKSLLTAGAFLFAMTGHSDPRPCLDGSKTVGATYALVHHGKEFCQVRLTGAVNGVGFRITRRVVKRKPILRFERQDLSMSWINETRTTMKLTQMDLINDGLMNLTSDGSEPAKMALSFLLRTIVWNQHGEAGPLEQGNGEVKRVLRSLVQADAWDRISQRQKELAKASKMEVAHARNEAIRHGSSACEAEKQFAVEAARGVAWETQQRALLSSLVTDAVEAEKQLMERSAALDAVFVPTANPAELEAVVALVARLTCQIAAADRVLDAVLPDPSPESPESTLTEIRAELEEQQPKLVAGKESQRADVSALAVARARYADHRSKVWRFEKVAEIATCEHCSQAITADHRSSHMAAFEMQAVALVNAVHLAEHTVSQRNSLLTRLNCKTTTLLAMQRVVESRGRLAVAKQKKGTALASLVDAKSTLLTLRTRAFQWNEATLHRQRLQGAVAAAVQQSRYLEQQRHRQSGLSNPHCTDALRSRIIEAQTSAASAAEEEAKASADMRIHTALADLTGPNGIQNALSARLLATLESQTAESFAAMSAKEFDLRIQFNEKGKVVQTISHGANRMPMNLLSGGELRRLKLAAFLAFSDVALNHRRVKMNVRVLDEPLAGVDGEGVRSFISTARTAFKPLTCFFISHRPYEAEFAFDSTLRIMCKDGASRIA